MWGIKKISLSSSLVAYYVFKIDKNLEKELFIDSFQGGCIRSSRSQMFLKIGVLKNFAKFTRNHLYGSLYF